MHFTKKSIDRLCVLIAMKLIPKSKIPENKNKYFAVR